MPNFGNNFYCKNCGIDCSGNQGGSIKIIEEQFWFDIFRSIGF